MAQIYLNVNENIKKRFKAKCAMDDITQSKAVEELVSLYADGKIQLIDTLNQLNT